MRRNWLKMAAALGAVALIAGCADDASKNPASNNGSVNNGNANNGNANNGGGPNNGGGTNNGTVVINNGTPIDPGEPGEEVEEITSELQATQNLTTDDFLQMYDVPFSTSVSYDPTQAAGFDTIQQSSLEIGDPAKQKLRSDGFVISKNHEFPSFVYGYQTLYMEDLPLYVSADSILHAVHRSYDEILKTVEVQKLIPELAVMLRSMRTELENGALSGFDPQVEADADLYLAVAASLLDGSTANPVASASASDVQTLVQKANDANGVEERVLFGAQRKMDFSQFKPRGHYTDSDELERYFRTMMWLGRVDLRILEPDENTHELIFHRNQLEMAYALYELIDADNFARWELIHDTVGAFVGEPDNMILTELDMLRKDLNIDDPLDLSKFTDQELVKAIQNGEYGTQRISSHFMTNGLGAGTMPLSSTFMIFGQRYVLDSHVFSNVVYDRVQEGRVKRMMPDPLDAAFAALGNDQAASLLEPELREYSYAPDLHAMRFLADRHPDSYWNKNLYNEWMGAIRALSPGDDIADWDKTGLPEVATTEAWGRRILNTQLASWSELRHDTILYVKQSYTGGASCEFPDAYVDPYPEFYRSIASFARHGKNVISRLSVVESETVADYFTHLEEVAVMLADMAEYQRTGEPFTQAQLAWINQAVTIDMGCGDPVGAGGWYPKLFLYDTLGIEYDPTIADVHTQPTDAAGNVVGNVLHVGTGMPRLMVVTVETCNGPRAYAGLASSYYEKITSDFERMNDEEWSQELYDNPPDDVDWVKPVLAP